MHAKELERLFEFDDLLNRVHDALTQQDNTTLVELLRERFRFGLIDEFQDTDDKQWDIFRRIFVGHQNGALYIIGDLKQAIYGFRGADIHTYIAARDSLLTNPDRPAARVPLNMNYRSTPAMIEAVNTILDTKGPHRLLSGPIRYEEPVDCGRQTLRLVDKSGNDIEPLTIWSRAVQPTGNRKSPSGASVMRAYLGDLVATIEQLLDPSEGYFIHEEGTSPKRLNGSDIFVLVRTGTEAALVTRTLRAAGITTARKSAKKIFQTEVCDDVIRLLTAIARPQQKSARMGLLYSAFIDMEPAQVASFADDTVNGTLMDTIAGWRRLAESGDYGALWRQVAIETGLLVRELHNPKGEQYLTIAGQIFETIVEVFGHRQAPIEDVIEHLTRWRSGIDIPDGIETGLRLAADDNAVQVMTIHKSKGLQAGVVFLLGGFGRAPSKRIRTVNHAGQRHVVVGKSACDAFKELLQAQAAEEDERLLYVGLTRAIAKMYLVTVESRGPLEGPYERLNSRLKSLLSEPRFERSFAIIDADHSPPQRPLQTTSHPPEQSLGFTDPSDRSFFDALRTEHTPWIVTSYSAMKEKSKRDHTPTDFGKVVIDEVLPVAGATNDGLSSDDTLPGGKHMGRFLHEVIEAIEFSNIASMTQENWAANDAVLDAFQITMRRHGVDQC